MCSLSPLFKKWISIKVDILKRHEEKCKEKDKGKNKILELESNISEMFDNQKEMLKLIKIHPKTLNKINNIEI